MALCGKDEQGEPDDQNPQLNAVVVSETASSSMLRLENQTEDAVPCPRLQFGSPDMANTISGWLRELRAEEPMKPYFRQPDLLQLELPGIMTYAGRFEQVPLYLDGKLYGRMEQRRSMDIT